MSAGTSATATLASPALLITRARRCCAMRSSALPCASASFRSSFCRFVCTSVANRSLGASFHLLCDLCACCLILVGLVPDRPYLTQQVRHLHARERLEQRGNLRRHGGQISRDLAHARARSVARRDDG